MTEPAKSEFAKSEFATSEFATSEFAESEFANSEPVALEPACRSDVSRYERACDEAIAMCAGSMRSTIKALIMANEYLEAELQELEAATSRDGTARLPPAKHDAA
jgi:hypothetical protein